MNNSLKGVVLLSCLGLRLHIQHTVPCRISWSTSLGELWLVSPVSVQTLLRPAASGPTLFDFLWDMNV